MELTINNLIKIILGIVVVAVVVGAVGYYFKNNVIDFFRNFGFSNESVKLVLGLLQ